MYDDETKIVFFGTTLQQIDFVLKHREVSERNRKIFMDSFQRVRRFREQEVPRVIFQNYLDYRLNIVYSQFHNGTMTPMTLWQRFTEIASYASLMKDYRLSRGELTFTTGDFFCEWPDWVKVFRSMINCGEPSPLRDAEILPLHERKVYLWELHRWLDGVLNSAKNHETEPEFYFHRVSLSLEDEGKVLRLQGATEMSNELTLEISVYARYAVHTRLRWSMRHPDSPSLPFPVERFLLSVDETRKRLKFKKPELVLQGG